MWKKIIVILLIIHPAMVWCQQKMASLPDIMKPEMIGMDADRLYVSDESCIKIFSLENFKLTGKIGRQGEGPGEFLHPVYFQILPDCIVVNGLRKYGRFTRDGELIDEKRFDWTSYFLYAVGNRYINYRNFFEYGVSIFELSIMDDHFTKIKDIDLSAGNSEKKRKRSLNLLKAKTLVRVASGLIFVSYNGVSALVIDVFDEEGVKLKRITGNEEKIKVSKDDKRRILGEFFARPPIKKRLNHFKKLDYTFPEYFPAIKDFFVADRWLYVKTYEQKGDKEKWLILDMDGKLLKSLFLPETQVYLYTFVDKNFYYLKHNEDQEMWEFFRYPIDHP